ncbi:hypothetical protein [Paracoccus sp. (in: a-proteobacteria)]|uniref:hypothetical protein n=1 Tax=Paracoccus sp. TaxID=267 RepID=UPI003A8723B2
MSDQIGKAAIIGPLICHLFSVDSHGLLQSTRGQPKLHLEQRSMDIAGLGYIDCFAADPDKIRHRH